jgi:hypothetical protein
MIGLPKILLGIVLIIIFLATWLIVAFPIIWIGAGITGVLFIFYGIRDATAGEGGSRSEYSCKRCSFKARTRKEVIQHVLDTHQDSFDADQLADMRAFVEGKTHKCTFCGRRVSTKQTLLEHALEEHEADMTEEQLREVRQALGLVPA